LKDLIVITAHCPTEEQELVLERCINSVVGTGFHIALISHTHISLHIQKKCHYYIYDHFNDISDDVDLLGYSNFSFGDKKIMSKFFNKNFYGFAIYRMFSIASKIAKIFSYEKIHHIEYDCYVLDRSIITENSNLLDSYYSIIYGNDNENGIFGSFKSFSVKNLPDLFENYDRDKMEERIKDMKRHDVSLEEFTKKIVIENGNFLFKDKKELDHKFHKGDEGISKSFYVRNLHHTLFFDPSDNTVNIFYHSIKKIDEIITIIVNHEKVIEMKIEPNRWYIKKIHRLAEITHIRIDNSSKVIYEKFFDESFKKIFPIKSYITDAKNN
jgi:hypothetical protein